MDENRVTTIVCQIRCWVRWNLGCEVFERRLFMTAITDKPQHPAHHAVCHDVQPSKNDIHRTSQYRYWIRCLSILSQLELCDSETSWAECQWMKEKTQTRLGFSWPELESGQKELQSGQPGPKLENGQCFRKVDKTFLELARRGQIFFPLSSWLPFLFTFTMSNFWSFSHFENSSESYWINLEQEIFWKWISGLPYSLASSFSVMLFSHESEHTKLMTSLITNLKLVLSTDKPFYGKDKTSRWLSFFLQQLFSIHPAIIFPLRPPWQCQIVNHPHYNLLKRPRRVSVCKSIHANLFLLSWSFDFKKLQS